MLPVQKRCRAGKATSACSHQALRPIRLCFRCRRQLLEAFSSFLTACKDNLGGYVNRPPGPPDGKRSGLIDPG